MAVGESGAAIAMMPQVVPADGHDLDMHEEERRSDNAETVPHPRSTDPTHISFYRLRKKRRVPKPDDLEYATNGTELLQTRPSRWEPREEKAARQGWAPIDDKTFTPQCFSYLPQDLTLEEIEIWVRRHRIDDLQQRIAAQDYESNDPDIRSPSPEPIYDPKTGQR